MNERNCYCLPFKDIYEKYSKKLYWPVKRLEVYMPQIKADKLNAFERLVLELLAATDDRNAEQTAQQLGISPRIYERIAQHLTGLGLLSKNHELTQKGQDTLSEKNYIQEDASFADAVKYILLQDQISGSIIPYVFPEDAVPESIADDVKGQAIFLTPTEKIGKPTVQDVRAGLKTYNELLEKSDDDSEENDEPNHDVSYRENIDKEKNRENSIRVYRILEKDNSLYYVECHLNVNPMTVTNQELDDIWALASPFGDRIDEQWLKRRLEKKMHTDPQLKEAILDSVFQIREEMRGKIPFRNELNIPLFEEYPEITLDKGVKERIESLVLANKMLDEQGLNVEDTWRIRLGKTLEEIMNRHIGRLSIEQKQAVADLLTENEKEKFIPLLQRLFRKYGITGAEPYLHNRNITSGNMRKIANNDKWYRPYKKDAAVFMLLAAEACSDRQWLALMQKDFNLYENIFTIDRYRNQSAAHASDQTEGLSEKERTLGMNLVRELVAAYYSEE